ncbi:MAG: DUF488 domain-containing protein [Rhodobacteraceae bacterium]|nr:DUF488 domain-containing protein [Paracoccaceae bacterium]
MTKPKTIYTIGYEGTTLEQFLQTLAANRIEALADVRALPLSRKPGFSKNGLAAALATRGISYRHFRWLGNPKSGRDAARAGDRETFVRIFGKHMETEQARAALSELLTLAKTRTTCLMCFERDARQCHRSLISDQIDCLGHTVFNLVADIPVQVMNHDTTIPCHHPRQSITAAE